MMENTDIYFNDIKITNLKHWEINKLSSGSFKGEEKFTITTYLDSNLLDSIEFDGEHYLNIYYKDKLVIKFKIDRYDYCGIKSTTGDNEDYIIQAVNAFGSSKKDNK
ncbi:MAG: hypothetical protein ACOCP8_04435 [archaeon]